MTVLSIIYRNDWLTLTFDIKFFLCHPIRKLSVSINHLLWFCTQFTTLSTDLKAKETDIYEIKSRKLRS